MTVELPLMERHDYAQAGNDQLEQRFMELPDELKSKIEEDFKKRLSMNNNIERIANEIFLNDADLSSDIKQMIDLF